MTDSPSLTAFTDPVAPGTGASAPRGRHWTAWVVEAAAAWSAGYALLGLVWLAGGPGFPFGSAVDPMANLSALRDATQPAAAPVITVLALAALLTALAMRSDSAARLRRVLLAAGVLVAMTLLLVVPDHRVLVLAAYAPVIVVGLPFGWQPDGSFLDVVTWPLVNQLVSVAGGLAWIGAVIAYARRTRGACEACGRRTDDNPDRTRRTALLVGRTAVVVAMAVPLVYAATRWAWVLGIPLGIDETTLRQVQADGPLVAPLGLGSVAVGGALLTTGLVMRWGEVFPAWLPRVGGRRVPPRLAVIPAVLVSVFVTTAGLSLVRLVLADGSLLLEPGAIAAFGQAVLWPAWGAALATAAVAYHYRTRPACDRCGLGARP